MFSQGLKTEQKIKIFVRVKWVKSFLPTLLFFATFVDVNAKGVESKLNNS